jgi:hypothetical protein
MEINRDHLFDLHTTFFNIALIDTNCLNLDELRGNVRLYEAESYGDGS